MAISQTTVGWLLLAAAAIGEYEIITFRAGLAQKLVTLADVVGRNCTAALAFDDRETAKDVLAFFKLIDPHVPRDLEVNVVLDNLSTHDTPDVRKWLARNPNITFHFTPVGSSWINQIETWFGIITRQAIRRGTFTSTNALIQRIRAYIEHWNTDAEPFAWTATADEILAKVAWVQTNIKQLVDNNAK